MTVAEAIEILRGHFHGMARHEDGVVTDAAFKNSPGWRLDDGA